MGFTESKARTLIIFSTVISAIGLIAAFATKLTSISLLLATILFLAHLPILWVVQKGTQPAKTILARMQTPGFAQIGFLLCTSVFSSSLGFRFLDIFIRSGIAGARCLDPVEPSDRLGHRSGSLFTGSFGRGFERRCRKKRRVADRYCPVLRHRSPVPVLAVGANLLIYH